MIRPNQLLDTGKMRDGAQLCSEGMQDNGCVWALCARNPPQGQHECIALCLAAIKRAMCDRRAAPVVMAAP
jgi:hypothetical protein